MSFKVSGNRFAGLDHCRALAILLVFVYHYRIFGHPPHLDGIGSFGWTGVDLFFVLSGYLIGGQLLARIARNQPISYGEFYMKRLLRIIPAYLAVLILYFTIPAWTERSALPPLWRFLTFTQNFGLDLVKQGAFSHAWSLCIEEQFYLILPLFIIIFQSRRHIPPPSATAPIVHTRRHMTLLLPALFLTGLALRLWSWYHFIDPILQTPGQEGFGKAYYRYIYYPTYTRLDGLLAGVTLAALYHFRPASWQRITRHGNGILLIGLLLLAGAWWIAHDDNQETFTAAIAGFPLIALAYGVIVLSALSPSSLLYKYSSALTRWIATLSYAIYLTHKSIIHLTHNMLTAHGIGNDTWLSFWICVVTCALGAWILHWTVEKPFLTIRDKWLAKKKEATRYSPGPSL